MRVNLSDLKRNMNLRNSRLKYAEELKKKLKQKTKKSFHVSWILRTS